MKAEVVVAVTVMAFVVGYIVGGVVSYQNTSASWRTYLCAQSNAVLVADTLCVRSDSSFRVPEPPHE